MVSRSLNISEIAGLGLLAAICGVSLPLFAQSAPALAHKRDVPTLLVSRRWPKWSGDRLVTIDHDRTAVPVIHTIDHNGRDEQVDLDLPGAAEIYVFDWSAGFDGALAAVGCALTDQSPHAHFLVWVSPDRKRRTVVRLSPYVADAVTVAGDGTIWTVGGIRTENPDRSKAQGNVLKRFDISGEVLMSAFPKGRAQASIAPDAGALSFLVASPDRVGWFTNGDQFIEFALDGRELGRFDGPPGMDIYQTSGVAMDAQDGVFVGDARGPKFQVVWLDRSKRTWEPAPLSWASTPHFSRIFGFDGTTLITGEHPDMIHRFARTSEATNGGPKP